MKRPCDLREKEDQIISSQIIPSVFKGSETDCKFFRVHYFEELSWKI